MFGKNSGLSRDFFLVLFALLCSVTKSDVQVHFRDL